MNIIKRIKGAITRDLTAERDERCIPVARAILTAIADYDNVPLNDEKRERTVEAYAPLANSILTILLNHNFRAAEVDYTFRLLQFQIDTAKNMVATSLNKNIEKASDILWGKTEKELTLGDIDAVLVKNGLPDMPKIEPSDEE